MKEEDHRTYPIMVKDLMVKGNNLYVTSVTIQYTLQGIVEHLKIKMEWIGEKMHLYVSYAINLDT